MCPSALSGLSTIYNDVYTFKSWFTRVLPSQKRGHPKILPVWWPGNGRNGYWACCGRSQRIPWPKPLGKQWASDDVWWLMDHRSERVFSLKVQGNKRFLSITGNLCAFFVCLYWPPARNLFLFTGINSLLKGQMSERRERTPLNNPLRDFDALVCTKCLSHLFTWSLCELQIHN